MILLLALTVPNPKRINPAVLARQILPHNQGHAPEVTVEVGSYGAMITMERGAKLPKDLHRALKTMLNRVVAERFTLRNVACPTGIDTGDVRPPPTRRHPKRISSVPVSASL